MPTNIDELTVRVTADTSRFDAAMRDLGAEADRFSRSITRAFRDAVVGGKSFEDVLKRLGMRLAEIALDRALQPIGAGIGDLISRLIGGVLPFANGGVLNAPNVRRLAQGGVLSGPTILPAGRSAALAGEAGPEAVLPLSRGRDGRLGVRAEATAPISVTINVTTPDAESFRKSEAQVAAMLARAVGRGRRGL